MKNFSTKKSKTFFLLLILLVIPLISFNTTKNNVVSGYTVHDPIVIDEDADLTGFPGAGTAQFPYLIDGYDISTTDNTGIFIDGSSLTKHITVQNCYIDANVYGMYIINVNAGRLNIINNTFVGQDIGIGLFGSYVNVTENTCYNNDEGITVGGTFNNISSNICYDNNDYGIDVRVEANNNTIFNNTCYNNYIGIEIYDSESNIVVGNTLQTNSFYGLYIDQNLVTADNNEIYLNIFDNNGPGSLAQAYDDSTNYWYSQDLLVGNMWSDWSGSGTYSLEGGAVDPYPQEYPLAGPEITAVSHTPSSPLNFQQITISADITDFSGISSALLYYQVNSAGWTSTTFSDIIGDTFSVDIGPFSIGDVIDYYITAEDGSYFKFETVEDNGGAYYQFTVVEDLVGPTITNVHHVPPSPIYSDSIYIIADVVDPSGIFNVTLHYRSDGEAWSTVELLDIGNDQYRRDMTFGFGLLIEYYVSAIDNSANLNQAIEDNGGLYYSFTIPIPDLILPEITYVTQLPTVVTIWNFITVEATITDSSGIFNATVYYRVNGGSWIASAMFELVTDSYSTYFGLFSAADVVEYYLEAIDDSAQSNVAIEDNGGSYFSVTIIDEDTTPPVISEVEHFPTPVVASEFVFISATVTDPSGIFNVTAYYRVNGGSWLFNEMFIQAPTLYQKNLGSFSVDDLIEYYIVAFDSASGPVFNMAIEDNGGLYYSFTVVASIPEFQFNMMLFQIIGLCVITIFLLRRKKL